MPLLERLDIFWREISSLQDWSLTNGDGNMGNAETVETVETVDRTISDYWKVVEKMGDAMEAHIRTLYIDPELQWEVDKCMYASPEDMMLRYKHTHRNMESIR